jgi:hypothetical protein
MRTPHSTIFSIHAAITLALSLLFVMINLVTGVSTFWAVWPIWVMVGLLAAHAGLAVFPKHRLLGLWIGFGAFLIIGLIGIDLANDGTPWWFWPAGVWVVLTALFVGLSVDLLAMVPGTHTTPPEDRASLPE